MLEVEIASFSISPMGYAVVLKNPSQEKVVPIFIGPSEINAIANAKEGIRPERPLTHDLAATVLQEIGTRVDKVFINKFENGVFFARLFLEIIETGGMARMVEMDARPSDAIALAVRFSAPVFIAEHIYEMTSVAPEQIEEPGTSVDTTPSLNEDEKEALLNAMLEHFQEAPEENEEPAAPKSKIDVLREQLDSAVEREDYEEAARLRDELASILSED